MKLKRHSGLQVGLPLPHAPGARMTVVKQTPSNYLVLTNYYGVLTNYYLVLTSYDLVLTSDSLRVTSDYLVVTSDDSVMTIEYVAATSDCWVVPQTVLAFVGVLADLVENRGVRSLLRRPCSLPKHRRTQVFWNIPR